MTFTDRTILAALVALAIPVLVHLWGRRRARRMVLPTVRFAEAAHQASRAATWLRRAALLALRLAAVALLVLALAGPRIEGDQNAATEGATGCSQPVPSEGQARLDKQAVAPRTDRIAAPIRVLIVDAEEAGEGVNSADLVAATFTGDTNIPKQVTRTKSDEIEVQDLAAANVIFWVGARPQEFSPLCKFLEDYLVSGGRAVFIPGSAPRSPKREIYGPPVTMGESDGMTIDPDGYTSDLLAAFEGGTSGDLAAPVFRRFLNLHAKENLVTHRVVSEDNGVTQVKTLRPEERSVVQFHGGATAIADYLIGRGRVVALAFGPDPYWGDLAGRPEFVVLMQSLAEALGPKLAPKPYLAPGEYTGGTSTEAEISHEPPPVYSRGANDSRGANKAGTDLTLWFILALAVVLAAESLLAAASAPRGSNK